jgi:hypothetical protein
LAKNSILELLISLIENSNDDKIRIKLLKLMPLINIPESSSAITSVKNVFKTIF